MIMKSEFLRSQCSLNAHCGTSAANPAIFTIISEYLAWLWSSLCWINADLLYLDAHFTDATPCSGKLCGKQAGAGGARLISWQSRSTDSNKLEDSGVESCDEVCAAAGFAPLSRGTKRPPQWCCSCDQGTVTGTCTWENRLSTTSGWVWAHRALTGQF